MSVRFPTEPPTVHFQGSVESEVGSLFGPSIDATDVALWERLSGSPIVRATTPSEAPSSVHLGAGMDVEMDVERTDGSVVLDSVVHLHETPVEFAYCYFERDAGTAQLRAPSGAIVTNSDPVRPRVVEADVVVWQPVLGADGRTGHKFLLAKDGVVQAQLEAYLETDTDFASPLQRVLAVHGLYTTLAHTAHLVDRHSLLEFNSVETHTQRLYDMLSSIDSDQLYLPVNELVIGSALAPTSPTRLLATVPPALAAHPHAAHVSGLWDRVVSELHQLSSLVTNCIHQHNTHEFTRNNCMY